MSQNLVLVESPAKARTLARMLGDKYAIKASLGHVRDLPQKSLGVEVDNDFTPHYLIIPGKRSVVKELKAAAQKARTIFLATDPDREGEAISWHLVQAAGLEGKPMKRVVFHEITREAVEEAFRHPRDIDMKLVEAQQARRILDRLVGYKISPLLWRKVKGAKRGLSAGRVQSVALRLVVDREKEIEAFVPVEYWTIHAELEKEKGQPFRAALVSYLGREEKLQIPDEKTARALVRELEGCTYSVAQVKRKEVSRTPSPPFITSTLQQEAWRKLGFTAQRTMTVAQQLYEGLPVGQEGSVGLITYMRTDSTRIAATAQAEVRDYVNKKLGADFLPPSPRVFKQKVKGAQEAHEAIRPTSVWREPGQLKPYLTSEQLRLYDLIWKRTLASQMASARLEQTTVEVAARNKKSGQAYLLKAQGSQVLFPGFLTLYSEGRDEANEEEESPLPRLSRGNPLTLLALYPEQHFTQPPPRYSEASLIKALEENGIGRPSTYAAILSILNERDYVRREKGRLRPTQLGRLITDLLQENFADIVDVSFTAQMEGELDEIARGRRKWVPVVRGFYEPFEEKLSHAHTHMEKVRLEPEATSEVCEKCGKPMVIKHGRYGRFLSCSGFPECRNARPLRLATGIRCPRCGAELLERRSKKGRTFFGCSGYPQCDFATWQRPLPHPCPHCGGLLVPQGKKGGRCLKCDSVVQGEVPEMAAPVAHE